MTDDLSSNWRRDHGVPWPSPDSPPQSLDNRVEISVGPDEHRVTSETIQAMVAAPELYQRGGDLVRVLVDAAPIRGLVDRKASPRIDIFPVDALRELSTKHIRYTREIQDRRTGERKLLSVHPPAHASRQMAARGQWESIRPLAGVSEVPVIRADGSIVDDPGYDTASSIVYLPSTDFGKVPASPTRADAQAALAELYEVVTDFQFKHGSHRSAWLAALLTLFSRNAIGGPVPGVLVDGNVRGVGKGLCVDTVSLIVTGRPAPISTNAESDEEMRKTITAFVVAGIQLVLIDNISGDLGCQALDAALTGYTWSQRLLGTNETTRELPMKVVFFFTGNNVQLVGDIGRRLLHIRLETAAENPESRTGFRHPNLREWILQERPRLVRAALTVLRAYAMAGRPPVGLAPIGSYEAWCKLVRNCVVWLGEPDPGETRTELTSQADTDRKGLALMIEALATVRGGMTTAEMIAFAFDRNENGSDRLTMREAISELCPTRDGKPPSTVALGKRLAARRRRVIDGKCIDEGQSYQNRKRWRVFTAEEIKQVDEGGKTNTVLKGTQENENA
jgi:hypothetical protein